MSPSTKTLARKIISAGVRAAAFLIASATVVGAEPALQSHCNDAAPAPVAKVDLPGRPFSIVPTADGCWIFVSLTSDDPKSNGVAVLRRSGGTITFSRLYPITRRPDPSRPLRPGPAGLVMTHDARVLIAANDDEVLFLDVPTLVAGKANPVIGRMSDGNGAGSFYVNVTKGDSSLFVADEFGQAITVIDLVKARHTHYDSSAIVGKIPVGIASISLTLSPDERWLYTTSEVAPKSWNWPIACPPDRADRARFSSPEIPEGAIIVIDVKRAFADPVNAVIARVPAGCAPVRMTRSHDGSSLWVSVRRSDSVLAFDAWKLIADPGHARIASVPVGTAPVGIMALPDGKRLVVANSNRIAANPNDSQTVSIIDMQKALTGAPAVAGSIPAGAFPREFGLSPDGNTLFLGNYLSQTLQIINLDTLSAMKN